MKEARWQFVIMTLFLECFRELLSPHLISLARVYLIINPIVGPMACTNHLDRFMISSTRVITCPVDQQTTTSRWYVWRFFSWQTLLTNKPQQTLKQRQANAKFAKKNINKQGKPRDVKKKTEFPVSKTWIFVLTFLICGGAVLELVRYFF